ncbi:TPA: hypothetical protein ACGO1T_001266 [Streptococcus suis]
MRLNLYVHYDSVSNHVMTRGINFIPADFEQKFIPNNLILETAVPGFGRFDSATNFYIVRGKQDVLEFLLHCQKEKLRIPDWIDFESMTLMHQLSPNEIAEILYLFHANQTLRSAFFYKLQNNYAYLTLPNGLIKTYYRQVKHFAPRFQRVMLEQMQGLLNEGKSLFFGKRQSAKMMPKDLVDRLIPLFARGLKIDITQAYQEGQEWVIPLFVIEDELTLLTVNQARSAQEGLLVYNIDQQTWELVLQHNG